MKILIQCGLYRNVYTIKIITEGKVKMELMLILFIIDGHCFVAFECNNNIPSIAEIFLMNTEDCHPTFRNITQRNVRIQLHQPKT